MAVQHAITSQYQAALKMLEETIERCPADLWIDPKAKDQYWQIVYHALFFTHLYLQESEASIKPWPKFRKDYHYLGPIPWENNRQPDISEPYSQSDMLEYLAFCREQVKTRLPQTDFTATSGFGWLPLDKLELQIYSIRHLQMHIGELAARLSARGVQIPWVGKGEGWS